MDKATSLPSKETPALEHMSEAERLRYEHEQLHSRHQGHETMHAEMLAVLIVTMVVAQIVLVEWKKRRFRSYQSGQFVTLIGLWLIPNVFCIYFFWWRFTCIWLVFSAVTMFLVKAARRKPIEGHTPRMVYKWFFLIYKVSYGLGLLGYFVLMLTLLGVNLAFRMKPDVWMDFGLMCLFYGLYYGVMGRDFAEICSDTMAATIGYYSSGRMPLRRLETGVCAVCGNRIQRTGEEAATSAEKTYQLACGHTFHEFCVRGWCIVGKKQTCPYCKEKVDLKRMFSNPWERPHVLYGQLLDWIRYLVAWQPLILTSVQLINWLLGLE